jgi:pullulanase
MKKLLLIYISLVSMQVYAQQNSVNLVSSDLGLTYTNHQSKFKVWAPNAEAMQVLLYNTDINGVAFDSIDMQKNSEGIWLGLRLGDLQGVFYTYKAKYNGIWSKETTDPNAKAVGTNGQRAAVIDIKKTNPAYWFTDKAPVLKNKTDAVIYELHVRDASIAINSGIKNKGKFIGLIETGTKNKEGLKTGLDHLVELGVTHVHLLPSFDYNSVNEALPNVPQFNWGYDPVHYNTPEGSYSTNPADPATRIKEFKALILALHQKGIGVIMDVVYNHTALTKESNFNILAPNEYYRLNSDCSFSDGSGCGNETASDKPMFRKFMLESLQYWVNEYHVDGFRFDLMGLHDIETMNQISETLHSIKPSILLYGEGWTAGGSPLPEEKRAIKKHAPQLNNIAVFSDDIRDAIKGSVFEAKDAGFASAKLGQEESIKFGIVASTQHPQIDYSKVNYSKAPYANQPHQTITYAECHDNHVLWDRLQNSAANYSEEERRNMHKLALSIVLTSQGIPFLHAGTEFLRSKKNVENSYNSSDSINQINWQLKTKNKDVFEYVKGLIAIRKKHPAFRLSTTEAIQKSVKFLNVSTKNMVAYTINGKAVGDTWKTIAVIFNGNNTSNSITIPEGNWKVAVSNNKIIKANEQCILSVAPFSCTILYQ